MTFTKTVLAAVTLLALTGGPALAFNEGSVNQADIARVSSQVDRIAAPGARAEAQNLVSQARGQASDGEFAQASFTLSKALKLAEQSQVAEHAN